MGGFVSSWTECEIRVVSGKCKEKGKGEVRDTARMIRVTFQESLNFTRMKRSWEKTRRVEGTGNFNKTELKLFNNSDYLMLAESSLLLIALIV